MQRGYGMTATPQGRWPTGTDFSGSKLATSITVNEHSREFIRDWLPGSGAESYVASATIQATKREMT